MAIVTTSQNLTSVSYAAGEIIEIRNGATLTINSTPATRPGTIQCITSGKLRIENASTTTPIVLELNDQTRDLRFESNGILEVRGAMMSLGSGTGSSQTFNFASLYSGVLTDITYVEIEQTAGSGDYIPWHIVEVSSAYYHIGRRNRGSITTEYDGEHNVLFYNSDTRVLTSGNGTNGKSIPSGCNIRIPNILITNQDWRSDVTLIHQIVSNGTPTGGTFTITVINRRTATTIGTTAAIAFNATAATIDAALEAVLGASTITSAGGPLPTAVTLTLAGAFALTPLAFVVNSSVTGGTDPVIFSLENNRDNLTLLDLSPSGTADCECVMLSRKIRQTYGAFNQIRFIRTGLSGDGVNLNSSTGTAELDHVSLTPNAYCVLVGHSISSISGQVILNKIVASTVATPSVSPPNTAVSFTITALANMIKMDDVRALVYKQRAALTDSAMTISKLPINLPINRLHCLGGELNFNDCTGNLLTGIRHNDYTGTTQETAFGAFGIAMANCSNMVFADIGKLGTGAPREHLLRADALSTNIEVVSGSYDGSDNTLGLLSPFGVGLKISNFILTNNRTGARFIGQPANFLGTNVEIRKVFGSMVGTNTTDVGQGASYDTVPSTIDDFNEVNASIRDFVGGNFTNYGTTPTTGHVTFGAFSSGASMTVTGAAYTSQTGNVTMPNNGDAFIAEIPFSMHAVTSFDNASPRYFLQGADVFTNVYVIINQGSINGGTFTLTFYDSTDTLVGTTAAIAWNASAATVDTAVEGIIGVLDCTVAGSLANGYVITLTGTGNVGRFTVDGSGLTGGTEPGVAYAFGRARLLAAETNMGANFTFEYEVRNGDETTWAGTWTALTGANLSTAISGLTGYNANTNGFDMRIRVTTTNADPYRNVQQISMPTTINPSAWTVDDSSIIFQGPAGTDVVKIVRFSDDAVLYTFTGSGTKTFTMGANYDAEVYLVRENSGSIVLMQTLPVTFNLKFGGNGTFPLFYGAEIQLAQNSDITAIKNIVDTYLNASISSRASTSDLTVVNEGVKKASLLIPHTVNI